MYVYTKCIYINIYMYTCGYIHIYIYIYIDIDIDKYIDRNIQMYI